jgi:hypothetical protein
MQWNRAFTSLAAAAVLIALSLTGCAPRSRAEGVTWATKKHKATDAKLQRVKHWPALRVDAASLALLDEALAEPQIEKARPLAVGFVDQAAADARVSTRLELERLGDAGWRDINTRYYARREIPDAQARAAIAADFEKDALDQAASLRRRLD